MEWQLKIKKFVNDELIPWEVHAEKNEGELPKEIEKKHREIAISLGLPGMGISKESGGLGLNMFEQMIVWEQLGRVTNALCWCFSEAQDWMENNFTDYQKENYLKRLAAGDVGAYSLSEAGAGTDAAAMTCKAKLSEDGTHYVLNGEKMWVTNGAQAKIIVLFAKDVDHPDYGVKRHGGTTAFIVDSTFEGYTVGKKEDKLGIRSSDTCTLILEDCKVPVENVLKGAGNGFPIAMNALDNSRIGIAAQALGIAQGAYEASLRYAHEREAFGKPIAHHQMIMGYLADMATRIDAARHLVYKASWSKQQHYEHGGPRHSKEASMAKLFAGDTAMWVSERAIQIHGGYGYTKEFPVERFFRDAKITQIYEGTQEVQRIVIARSLL